MLKKLGITFTAMVTLGASCAVAQDEIVVTGSRLARYAADVVPSVTLARKADYVLVSYDFVCDTRDRSARYKELTKTLEDLLAKAAKRKDIELSVLVEYEDAYDTLYFPKPYTQVDANDFEGQYGRTDTSVQTVIIKTPVDAAITSPEAAEERIEDFIDSIKMDGRTIATGDDEIQLSVVDVARYRPELTAAILADVKSQKQALSGASVEISGLENTIRWERSGPLDLSIYIPYKVAIEIEG